MVEMRISDINKIKIAGMHNFNLMTRYQFCTWTEVYYLHKNNNPINCIPRGID